jgi:hypothetical protein
MNEKVLNLLEKHSYFVRAIKIAPDECRILFPNGKCIEYRIDRRSKDIRIRTSINESNESWICPEYSLRLVIAADIISRMKKLNILNGLIKYENEDHTALTGLAEIFDGPSNQDQLNKEGFLNTLLNSSVEDGFIYEDVAEIHGVANGYKLLRGILL